MVYLQAALNGEGIILGWETLFRDLLEQNQLVRVAKLSVATKRGYFACLSPRTRTNDNDAATKLWDWLGSLENA